MATDMTKLESAAITIAAGVHGTVPKDQLAATAVAIAGEVLVECEAYAAAQEAAAHLLTEHEQRTPVQVQKDADVAELRLTSALKNLGESEADAEALEKAVERHRQAKAAAKAAKDAEAAEKKKAEDVVKVKPAPQPAVAAKTT
jgi:hypothetical protein